MLMNNNRAQQGNVNEHQQSTTKRHRQTTIKHNDEMFTNKKKTQQGDNYNQ